MTDPTPAPNPLGEMIAAGRKALGWTQRRASKGICDPSKWCLYESGQFTPDVDRCAVIAERLGLVPFLVQVVAGHVPPMVVDAIGKDPEFWQVLLTVLNADASVIDAELPWSDLCQRRTGIQRETSRQFLSGLRKVRDSKPTTLASTGGRAFSMIDGAPR